MPGMFDSPVAGIPGMDDLPPQNLGMGGGDGPGTPVQLHGAGIPQAQPMPTPPAGPPGLAHRLMAGFGKPGMDPMASEWMTPQQQQYLQSQGQAGLASSLLQASGPRPQGTANFASRLGEASGAGLANWQAIQQNATQRAMQSISFGWQMQARDMLQKALAENPEPGTNASPAEKAARLSAIANRLALAGPLGAEYAKQYQELARGVLEGTPLNADQQTKIWNDAITPFKRAADAWDQYQGLSGKYDRIAIAQRAQLADQIMNPDKPQQGLGAYQNADVLDKIPGIGPILAAAFKLGKITPEDARYLDTYVKSESERARSQAAHILDHQRLIGEHGVLGKDWTGYYNPFDETGPRVVKPSARVPRPPRLPVLKP